MSGTTTTHSEDQLWTYLSEVIDPEIPVLNVVEMGIVRGVDLDDEGIIVRITPTYSGCPAMNAIEKAINEKLDQKGVRDFKVVTDYSEVWTTDWMTDHAKSKLKDYGIAPPEKSEDDADFLNSMKKTKVVPCPFCDSLDTELQSEFGSTACKSQYFCKSCQQPFEHFKCI
jgi:ring-1,2-phenylacetyl-CoA epoxidase subunit PaaD